MFTYRSGCLLFQSSSCSIKQVLKCGVEVSGVKCMVSKLWERTKPNLLKRSSALNHEKILYIHKEFPSSTGFL